MRPIRISLNIMILILLFVALLPPEPTAGQGQDLTFRLMNIERRMDQLQTRVDYIERSQQSQALNNSSGNNTATAAVLELQRQQLSLAEQILTMQKQMLEMQKKLDRLAPPPTPEKKDKPEDKPRPKAPTSKP